MKKVMLIGFLLLSVVAAQGQKNTVSRAYNLAVMVPADLETAQTVLTEAMKSSETFDAKSWYQAGVVYDKIVDGEKIKASLGGEEDKELKGESVLKAYDAFVKAYSLDILPNEKGKVAPKYTKQITNMMRLYQAELVNYGLFQYEKDYTKAVSVWEKYLDMPNLPFLKDAGIEKEPMYNEIMYYTANTAQLNEDFDTAIKYYEKVKDLHATNDSYQLLSQLYLTEKKDTVSYLKTIKTGLEKYPENSFFLGSLIDYYIYVDENIDNAFLYVSEAIKANPETADNYFIRGAIYEVKNENENALQDFLKAVKINEKHDRALSAIGNYYMKQGDELIRNAGRDAKSEKEAKDKATEFYKEAASYLERAKEIDSKNRANLTTLRMIYYKLYGDTSPKYIEVSRAIEALK